MPIRLAVKALSDSFYKNSIFIMLSSLAASALGLVFWILAARTYSSEEIGTATAIISAATLILTISKLGLDQSMMRFFPRGNRSRIFTTVVVTTSAASLAIGAIYVIGIDLFSPSLEIIKGMAPIFLALTVATLIANHVTDVFNSMRKAKYGFIQNMVMGSRLFLIFPLAFLGTLGLLSSILISYILALLACIVILVRTGLRWGKLDLTFLKRSWDFSIGNYVVVLLMTIPSTVLPILVFGQLGAENAAAYFIVYSLVSVLFIVPVACGTSLFVEGSHGENMKATARKSLLASFGILIPAVIALFFIGDRLLGIVGAEYKSNGTELLMLMALSSFFVVFFQSSMSVWKVRMNLRKMIVLGLVNCVSLLGLSYILMNSIGLSGIGLAWISGYGISAAAILVMQKDAGPC